MSEIAISQAEVDLALRNLRSWMKDEKVSKNLVSWGGGWQVALGTPRSHSVAPQSLIAHSDPGHTAGLSLHPEGALRAGPHHRALELPLEPDTRASGGGHCCRWESFTFPQSYSLGSSRLPRNPEREDWGLAPCS